MQSKEIKRDKKPVRKNRNYVAPDSVDIHNLFFRRQWQSASSATEVLLHLCKAGDLSKPELTNNCLDSLIMMKANCINGCFDWWKKQFLCIA